MPRDTPNGSRRSFCGASRPDGAGSSTGHSAAEWRSFSRSSGSVCVLPCRPAFAMAFARLVTHYVRHDAWIEDGSLLRNANSLAAIRGIMVNGRFDFQAPIGWAWDLKHVWPLAKLVIVDDAGHDASNAGITRELIRATDQFATR